MRCVSVCFVFFHIVLNILKRGAFVFYKYLFYVYLFAFVTISFV